MDREYWTGGEHDLSPLEPTESDSWDLWPLERKLRSLVWEDRGESSRFDGTWYFLTALGRFSYLYLSSASTLDSLVISPSESSDSLRRRFEGCGGGVLITDNDDDDEDVEEENEDDDDDDDEVVRARFLRGASLGGGVALLPEMTELLLSLMGEYSLRWGRDTERSTDESRDDGPRLLSLSGEEQVSSHRGGGLWLVALSDSEPLSKESRFSAPGATHIILDRS